MTDRLVVLELTRMEAAHLAGLVTQFAELVSETPTHRRPPMTRRSPDSSPTPTPTTPTRRASSANSPKRDLLDRRVDDAAAVLASLAERRRPTLDDSTTTGAHSRPPSRPGPRDAQAWLRTLAAIRLVLATGSASRIEDDHDDDDPRFGIYDWLGYRLDGLVHGAPKATDVATQGIAKTCVARLARVVPGDVAVLLLGPAIPVRTIGVAVAASARGACATRTATPARRGRRRAAPSPG